MGRKSDAACNMLTAFSCHLFKDLEFAGQRSRPFAKTQGDEWKCARKMNRNENQVIEVNTECFPHFQGSFLKSCRKTVIRERP